jgi:hypothetical protein
MAKKIIKEKYIKGNPLISVRQKQDDSHFWKKILSLRDIFCSHCKIIVGNGRKTSFWKSPGRVIILWLTNSLVFFIWLMIRTFQLIKSCLLILKPSLLEGGLFVI